MMALPLTSNFQPNIGVDLRELGERLTRLICHSSIGSSLPSLSSLSSLNSGMPSAKVADGSCSSLPSLQAGFNRKTDQNILTINMEKSEEERKKDLELYKELKLRKNKLEEKLLEKLEELREVCIKEAEITGEMPKEIYKTLMPGEAEPKVKRRIGTSFTLSEDVFKKAIDTNDKLAMLETDVELHRKIVDAAKRLANDKTTNKSVRKKRQKDFLAARQKLTGLELRLSNLRLSVSKPDVSAAIDGSNNADWSGYSSHHQSKPSKLSVRTGGSLMAKSCPTTPRGSIPDVSKVGEYAKSEAEDDDDDIIHGEHSRCSQRNPSTSSSASSHYSSMLHRISNDASSVSSGLPPSPNRRPVSSALTKSRYHQNSDSRISVDEFNRQGTSGTSESAGHLPLYENIGYKSCASYKSSYRQTNFPTLNDMNQLKLRQRAHSEHNLPLQDTSYEVPNSNSAVVNEACEHSSNSSHSRDWNCRSVDQGLNRFDGLEQHRVQLPGEGMCKEYGSESPTINGYKPVRVLPNNFLRNPNNYLVRNQTLSSSYSFTDGLSTSSLDRRAIKNRYFLLINFVLMNELCLFIFYDLRQDSCSKLQNCQRLNEDSGKNHVEYDNLPGPSGSQLLSRLSPMSAPRITTTFPVAQTCGVNMSNSVESRYRCGNSSVKPLITCDTTSTVCSPVHRFPPPSYMSALKSTSGGSLILAAPPLTRVTSASTDPHMEALLDYYKDAAGRKGKTATIV
uniref:DUF3338 domain-containing protein n=1 Tax=Syphacia muris TaxID=451379 RepID=A0A0N5A8T7_9BILA